MPKYHIETGFPKHFHRPLGLFKLQYTTHARNAARDDRYGDLSALLPGTLNTGNAQLIEIDNDEVHGTATMVYRMKATEHLDLVMVVAPNGGRWRVVTVWANERTDQHRTLRLDRYEQVYAA